MSDFNIAMQVVIHHEAYQRPDGTWLYYANNINDRGGPTAWGISTLILNEEHITLASLGLAKMEDMTIQQAFSLYERLFWIPLGLGNIVEQRVATKSLDLTVNFGKFGGTQLIQTAANHMGRGLTIDGIMGPATIQAINQCEPNGLITELVNLSMARYTQIIQRDPTQAQFSKSWFGRAQWRG